MKSKHKKDQRRTVLGGVALTDSQGRTQIWQLVKTAHLNPDTWGLCYPASHLILLSHRLSKWTVCATAIHEVLHATFPMLSEDAIEAAETNILKALLIILRRWSTTRPLARKPCTRTRKRAKR